MYVRARIIGRGWRVKREDLDAYVRELCVENDGSVLVYSPRRLRSKEFSITLTIALGCCLLTYPSTCYRVRAAQPRDCIFEPIPSVI